MASSPSAGAASSSSSATSASGLTTYYSVGKTFVKMSVEDIEASMVEKAEKDRRDQNVLQKTKDYLEKSIQDQEKALTEMFKK